MFAVASSYCSTLATAAASISQDALVSVLTQQLPEDILTSFPPGSDEVEKKEERRRQGGGKEEEGEEEESRGKKEKVMLSQ